MTLTGEYRAYVTALEAVLDLPKTHSARIDSIERRARAEIEGLDHRRNEGAQRWTQHRDTSTRLARRINELAVKVGAAAPGVAAAEPLPAASVSTALDALRAEVDRAEQSWQWLVRHRERERQMMRAPVPQPVYVPPPTPLPPVAELPPPRQGTGVNPTVLISVAVAVIVVLVIVIIAMAV